MAQGKAIRTVTAGTDVTIEAISPVGDAIKTYNVSGITAYANGFKMGEQIIVGQGDDVSLTLSNTGTGASLGYQYAYDFSGGTASNESYDGNTGCTTCTLQMPAADVTVSLGQKPIDWATEGNSGEDADHPYMIYNKDQLLLLAYRVNGTHGETVNNFSGKFFKLGDNIKFSHPDNEDDNYAENYEPIGCSKEGTSTNTRYYFKGNFDGDNHTISGIRLRKDGYGAAKSYQALFGCITEGANIHDIRVTDVRINCAQFVSGIVGNNNGGTISGCIVTNSNITANANDCGTICGYNNGGTLENNYYHHCTVNGKATNVGCKGADIDAHDGAVPVFTVATTEGITATSVPTVSYNGTDYYKGGATFTLSASRAGYIFVDYSVTKTVDGTDITTTALSGSTLTIPDYDVTVGAAWNIDPTAWSETATNEYTIHNADGWNVFCDALQDNDTYNRFSGRTVKLGSDIGSAQNPVTRMAGASKHDFCGTFDGQGYTMYVNISSDNAHDYTAPFSYVSTAKATPSDTDDSPAAIRNLNVAGTVTATKDYAGGIVGCFWGTLNIENCTSSVTINTDNKHAAGFISRAAGNVTIRNCLSSCTINSSKEGDGTHAGFIGGTYDGKTFTIECCAFTGSLLGSSTTHCAGFMGYNSGTLTITNSLFAPTEVTVSDEGSATFARNWTMPADANNYYTAALGTAQGTQGILLFDSGVPATANEDVISQCNTKQYDVKFQSRTLTKDSWNTLCLPFDLTSAQIESIFGNGTKVKTLSNYTNNGTTVTITYADAATITAGKPYIVKPTTSVENPVFTGVTIDKTMHDVTVGGATFKGTYSPVALTANDRQKLFLANNMLWYPTADLTVKSCRAYFELDADVPVLHNAPSLVIDYGDATGILSIDHSPLTIDHSSGAWYTLDGRKLDGKPAKKGVYINKGRQVVIK